MDLEQGQFPYLIFSIFFFLLKLTSSDYVAMKTYKLREAIQKKLPGKTL